MTAAVAAALALGSAYAAVGAAVTLVTIATRTLHLAVGQVLVAGVLVHLVLVSPAVGLPVGAAAAVALTAGAALSALLGPVVLDRLPDGGAGLLGLVVAAGIIDAVVVRTVTARPVVARPLLDLPPVGHVPSATVVALTLGLPFVAVLALLLRRTRAGRAIRLVGGAPAAAAAVGRDPAVVRVAALATAGAVAVLAGLLVAPVVTVGTAQAGGLTVRAVAAGALLGGQRPGRAVVGGATLGAAEVAGGTVWPAAGAELAVAAVVIGVLAWRGDVQRRGWGRAW
jgi:branched-subunit amino acid ABC-type transport system permease component